MKVEKLHGTIVDFVKGISTNEEMEVRTDVSFLHNNEVDACLITSHIGDLATIQLKDNSDTGEMADTVYRMVKGLVKNTRSKSGDTEETTTEQENI